MTDTPRRRPPVATKTGTLSIKPRSSTPDTAGSGRPDTKDWRKPVSGSPNRNRGKASFPEQANAEPERRARTPRDDSAPRSRDDRPRDERPQGDRPPRPFGDRPPRAGDERPARPYGDRPPRPAGDRPARPDFAKPDADARPPRHERKKWTGEPRTPIEPSPLRDDGSIRLSKRMTELGLCSRREADEYIEKGWVRVDGEVVSELGSRVKPGQAVELDRRGQTAQDGRVTFLLNKPVGYVSGQAEDGYEPASVLLVPDNRWAEDPSETRYLRTHQRGLAPAGRLDIDSVGLLVFTQDGRIARALIGDDSKIEKEYHVRVEGTVDAKGLALLNHGLSLDGEALRPAKVS